METLKGYSDGEKNVDGRENFMLLCCLVKLLCFHEKLDSLAKLFVMEII